MKIQRKAVIIMAFFMLCAFSGCGLATREASAVETPTPSNDYVTQKAPGPNSYDSADQAVVVSMDREENTITFLNLEVDMTYTLHVEGTSTLYDKYGESITMEQIVPGDVVEIKVSCKANEQSNMNIRASTVNDRVFREGYDILNASTLELTEFRNTYIEGTISCNRDGLLYTSIPQDGNWVATVDGKDVETVAVGDAMVGVMLTEGDHTVAFRYENKAFSLGWKISLVCLLIFIGISFCVYYPKFKKRKGKYEKI